MTVPEPTPEDAPLTPEERRADERQAAYLEWERQRRAQAESSQ